MKNKKQPLLQFESTDATLVQRDWLGLQIDHRQFLDALQDEWLLPYPDHRGRILAIAAHANALRESSQLSSSLITLSLQFDTQLLPRLMVQVRSGGAWHHARIDSLPDDAEVVFWPGAIPLYAISRIIVPSVEERARFLGIVRQVSNISIPETPIDVDLVRVEHRFSSELPDFNDKGIELTEEYGHARGAMTMAIWAVPRVDPWFDLLVASFSADRSRLQAATEAIGASWFAETPWRQSSFQAQFESLDSRLWNAALRSLKETYQEKGVNASAVVERIFNYAAKYAGKPNTAVENWRNETIAVLQGYKDLSLEDWKQCPVGKALQVLLLRPEPQSFVTWLKDLPGIPPSVWFSAATLCGYLHGYRRLGTSFRGGTFQRRMVAAQAFDVTSEMPGSMPWSNTDSSELTWHRDNTEFVIMCGEAEFARKAAYPRTLWYIADLDDSVLNDAASELARQLNWPCFIRRVKLSDTSIPFNGRPQSSVSVGFQAVVVHGCVDFDLPETACITESFDRAAFRKCLTLEGAPNIQAPPGKANTRDLESASNHLSKEDRQFYTHPVIHGLSWLEGFLTLSEEAELVAHIDAAKWQEDLKRRVQHYGWRYDYKTRQISEEMRLGPLPFWAAKLAERLTQERLLPHAPDQVIVNEYKGRQGISKHIDCKPCFDDGIATISLLESWEMLFSRGKDEEQQRVLLPRRSVAILTDEARYQWMHEIPKRTIEPGGLYRERRISVTFRKVLLDNSSHRSSRNGRQRPLG